MMYIRYPLALHNLEDLRRERGIEITMNRTSSSGTVLVATTHDRSYLKYFRSHLNEVNGLG